MNKLFKLLALTVCVLSGYISYAQSSITVSGTVKDSEGFPVIGAAVMLEGYKFVRWEDNSGRDISKAIESGESATSMLIHLSASGDFSLGLVIEAEDKVTLDLTWLWYVLGGIGGAGLVVLIVLLIKNRKRRENFLQYY